METLFLKLLNTSIAASYLILAVILLRLLLKKAPKWMFCGLWAIVGLRLALPFSIESVLSLVPSAETVPENIIYSETPAIDSGFAAVNGFINPTLSQALAPATASDSNPILVITQIAAVVWVAGLTAMLLYAIISCLDLRFRVRTAVGMETDVWLSDGVGAPFVFGILRPKIYLPIDLDDAEMQAVLFHERAHIARRDHWFKPLGFLLLSVYWFNPLMWLAYVLLCRDIEFACDERVIKDLDLAQRKAYSQALLKCSSIRHVASVCPLAFGEAGVTQRIKAVLNYKKPAFWGIIGAAAVCVALAVCFLTDPVSDVASDISAKLTTPPESSGDSYMEASATDLDHSGEAAISTEQTTPPENSGEPYMEISAADLDHDGEAERICWSDEGDGIYGLWVFDHDGSALWNDKFSIFHVDWNSYYLCVADDGDCLLRYNPYTSTGYSSYTYELLSLDGGEQTVKSGQVEFSMLPTADQDSADTDAMMRFADEANQLLSRSSLLISTQGGKLRLGPSPAELETYSFINEYAELFSGVEDLKTKLDIYFDQMRSLIDHDGNAAMVMANVRFFLTQEQVTWEMLSFYRHEDRGTNGEHIYTYPVSPYFELLVTSRQSDDSSGAVNGEIRLRCLSDGSEAVFDRDDVMKFTWEKWSLCNPGQPLIVAGDYNYCFAVPGSAANIPTVTLDPEYEKNNGVPFSAYYNGKEVSGLYGIQDAETGESLEHIITSGLSSQTYLLQYAQPGRAYLVSLSLNDTHSVGQSQYMFLLQLLNLS